MSEFINKIKTAEGTEYDIHDPRVVDPATASAGQVWTADGEGGAAWVTPETPSGGTKLYRHVCMFNNSEEYTFIVISKDATPITFELAAYGTFNFGLDLNSVVSVMHNDYYSSPKIFIPLVFLKNYMGPEHGTIIMLLTLTTTGGMGTPGNFQMLDQYMSGVTIESFTDTVTPL